MILPVRGRGGGLMACAACGGILLVAVASLAAPAGHAGQVHPVQAQDDLGGPGVFAGLEGVGDIEVTTISGDVFALVASWDERVWVVDITDPARPAPVAVMVGGQDGFAPGWAVDVEAAEIGNGTYALMAGASVEAAVQVANITDPARPAPVSVIRWQGDPGPSWISDVEVAVVDGRTYALVANPARDAVQVTEITDPARPRWVSTVYEGRGCADPFMEIVRVAGTGTAGLAYQMAVATTGGALPAAPLQAHRTNVPQGCFAELAGAVDIGVAEIAGRPYALVAGRISGDILVMDLTDPAAPVRVGSFTYREAVLGATPVDMHVEMAQMGGITYALVAVPQDNTVVVVELSRPALPVEVIEMSAWPGRAQDVEAVVVDDGTYLLVAGWEDGGLGIVEITGLASIRHHSFPYDGPGGPESVRVVEAAEIGNGTYALAAGWVDGGLWVANITDPANPAWISGAAPAAEWPLLGP